MRCHSAIAQRPLARLSSGRRARPGGEVLIVHCTPSATFTNCCGTVERRPMRAAGAPDPHTFGNAVAAGRARSTLCHHRANLPSWTIDEKRPLGGLGTQRACGALNRLDVDDAWANRPRAARGMCRRHCNGVSAVCAECTVCNENAAPHSPPQISTDGRPTTPPVSFQEAHACQHAMVSSAAEGI